MEAVGWTPPPLETGVPTDTPLVVTFSDYPDPDTVSVSSLLLNTGVFRVPEGYRVDLITRSVQMIPISELGTNLGYAVNVLPSLRSLAGCPTRPAHTEFTTGNGRLGTPLPSPPTFADIGAIFAAACAGNCHAAPDGTCLAAPAAGLSLCLAEARDALIDVPSREVAGLALVTPRDAARSYLLRKLIPSNDAGAPLPGTLGQREPPGPPLPDPQLRAISDWIGGGALP
jgi:hypothetical protein